MYDSYLISDPTTELIQFPTPGCVSLAGQTQPLGVGSGQPDYGCVASYGTIQGTKKIVNIIVLTLVHLQEEYSTEYVILNPF